MNFRQSSQTDVSIPFAKNTVYRFLNQQAFHWEKFLLAVLTKMVAFFNTLTSEKRATALVIDDSLFSKNRSKKVELLSRVFDHTSHIRHRKPPTCWYDCFCDDSIIP